MNSWLKIGLAAFLAYAAVADYTPDAVQDEVLNLPGTEKLTIPFRQFSGYLPVSETKRLHYWFVESSKDPANDPVAFWTNGGPGCSGLLGFLTEQGPFRPNKDLSLELNPYAWNTIANMVFIEAPCGVGFSYSENPDGDDYHTDDATTASDNYKLIQAFLGRFPQYRTNDLYITSESYGGHYMPTLAQQIVNQNAVAAPADVINFKGFAVGNPATTFFSTIPASMDTYWGHQLVSKPLWDKYTTLCRDLKPEARNFTICESLFVAFYHEVGDLNPYALDYPVCTESATTRSNGLVLGQARSAVTKFGRSQRSWLINHMIGAYELEHNLQPHQTKAIRDALKLEPVAGYEPCADDYMTTYLNQASVKAAIHVKADVTWVDCSRTLRYSQRDGSKSMTPIYNYLIDGGYNLNILVYSGDDDDVCGTIGTQSWIWGLGYDVSGKAWQPYTVNDQVAGYLTKWANTKLAFATVRAAGHEVPTYKPEIALYLFNAYLKGELTNA